MLWLMDFLLVEVGLHNKENNLQVDAWGVTSQEQMQKREIQFLQKEIELLHLAQTILEEIANRKFNWLTEEALHLVEETELD